MAGNVTNTLIANITSGEQSSGNVDINRGTGNPAFNTDLGQFTTYRALGVGRNNIQIPMTGVTPTATQVYIKNVDPAISYDVFWRGSNAGLLSLSILTLNPGDQIMFWCDPDGPTTPGITQLQIENPTDGALIEYFIGGKNS